MSAESLVRSLKQIVPVALVCGALAVSASAGDFRITIPKRSKPTPVQDLNRAGVRAVQKHDYEKARRLFYKAYLLDPDDPFTLNNLGYMSELDGDVERAQRFYDLSGQMGSDAMVDKSTTEAVIGKPVSEVAGNAAESGMQANRLNVAAIGLLQKDRAPEADVLLTKALAMDPKNAFTLNNLGYAKEKEGDLEEAIRYYTRAANTNDDDTVIVTLHRDWRGKPIREVAQENAGRVRDLLTKPAGVDERVARLNLQGVSALNRNDRRTARQAFQQAYQLKKDDAFTLNNMGYLAEMDGDRETADFFYQKAQEAQHSREKVGVATRKTAEGQPLVQVAGTSSDSVDARIQRDLVAKRRQGGPVVLMTRDRQTVSEPAQPKHPTRKEGSDVVAIPVPKAGARVITPEAGTPVEESTTAAPTTEQPANAYPQGESAVPAGAGTMAPQTVAPATQQPATGVQPAQPQQVQPEPQLVQPQELEQPPNPTTSTPTPPNTPR